ncbi:MAG: Glu-tRNA(Gln) amidotransferase subunit GatD [Methanomassiliicoccales archaeon]|nr:Glu-tRNA(Gln) amidotransferase subunit GatD [Methanomassiliicoccales archaeon]
MSYSRRVADLLRAAGAEEGDNVRVSVGVIERSGVLMPHHEFSDPDVVVLKQRSGYNIGVRLTEGATLTMASKGAKRDREVKSPIIAEGKKRVAVLGTGGTIASYVDYRTGAVHPALSATDLVSAVPEMAEVCQVDAKVIFSIFSENMRVEYWQRLAEEVADRLSRGDEGVIVPHGTDTMGYTSAALSFMLDDLPGPVVLVGAQRSSDRPSSDAYTNLISAARFCVGSDAAEVFVLMHGSMSDDTFAVHRGTRVRKMHTSRRDAFQSINEGPVARMDQLGRIEALSPYRVKSSSKVRLRKGMEEKVCLVHFYPGMSPSALESFLAQHQGAVIAGTGLGHVSRELVEVVRKQAKKGLPVVMTSQCLSGRVNLNVYDTGRDLLNAGVIPGEDMLPETALVKLMWVLANTKGPEQTRSLMLTNMKGEISERREA